MKPSAASSARREKDMIEPRYSSQIPRRRFNPLYDLTDEEFDRRLDELMQSLEAPHEEAARPR
jgi:hypothetical protein